MDGLGHQLLADPGLAGDQHRQRAVTDKANFVLQLAQRRALPHQLARLLPRLLVQLGELALGLDPLRQAADSLADLDRGRRQAGEGCQALQVDLTKAGRIERIQGQQAPELFVQIERTTEAIVHFKMTMQPLDQAVVGVGQTAVGGETARSGVFQQCSQARMLADLEASAQGIGAEPLDRQGHQDVAIKPQQRHGIARKELAQGRKQAAVTFAVVQLTGQIGDQRNQGFKQRISGGHFDYSKSL